MILKKSNIFLEIILFFSSFCYLKFFNVGTATDLQLYYFVFSCIFLFFTIKKVDKIVLISGVTLTLLLSFNFILDYKDLLSYFRGGFAYISFLVVFYTFYKLCKKIDIKIIESRIKLYFITWNLVGIIQMIDNTLFIFWRNRDGMAGGRGSISLATEPAYYVFFLILSSLILYSIDSKNRYYFLISLLLAVVVAKSFTGVFYLLIFTVIIYMNKKNILIVSLFSLIMLILIIIFAQNIPKDTDYRILMLLKRFVENPAKLFLVIEVQVIV